MTSEFSGMTLIAGCGVSGRAAARLAARLGTNVCTATAAHLIVDSMPTIS